MADTTIRTVWPGAGAVTIYTFIRDSLGNLWNGSAYVAPSLPSWATYATATPETPAGFGVYVCQFPLSSPPGNYNWSVYLRAGGSPASTDVVIGSGSGWFDGETFGNSPAAVAANDKLTSYDDLIDSGTVDDPNPTPTTFIGSSDLSEDSNLYRTLSVCFTSGELKSAKAVITAYNGATKRFTFAGGFAKAPANGDSFSII